MTGRWCPPHHPPHAAPLGLTVSFCMWLMPTQSPSMQTLPGAHGVPSAQGKCFVWQTERPLTRPVHHSEAQGGCRSPQCRESGPKASWHCRSTG